MRKLRHRKTKKFTEAHVVASEGIGLNPCHLAPEPPFISTVPPLGAGVLGIPKVLLSIVDFAQLCKVAAQMKY